MPPLDCSPSKLSLVQLRRIVPKLITVELGMKRPIFNEDRQSDWWPEHVPFVNVRQKPDSVKGRQRDKISVRGCHLPLDMRKRIYLIFRS